MERREFVQKLGFGSAAAAVVTTGILASSSSAHDGVTTSHSGGGHNHEPVKGPNAMTTVAFGSWRSDTPVDRYPNVSAAAANVHLVIPYQVTIKPGGAVAFAISGFHQVIVYGPDSRPEHINSALTRPSTGTPA